MRAFDLATTTWFNYDSNGSDIPVTLIPDVAFGPVVYTQAEIDAWPSTGTAYTALSGDGFMTLSRSILDIGTACTDVTERNAIRDNAVYAKGQACLWAADANASRLAKVTEVLDSVKDITSYNPVGGSDNQLVASWFATNICQAATITGYPKANLDNFLRNVIYPILDWTTGGNWFMSFSDSRLAIASYLEDPDLWVDATEYFEFHLPQVFYHATYDSGLVVPCRNGNWPAKKTGSVNTTRTVNHWGGTFGAPQITNNLVAEYPVGTPFPNGTDAERRRDLSHICFSLAAAQHACRTILAVGDSLPTGAYDRVRAAYDYHATRVKSYIDSGYTTIPSPSPPGGDGGTGYKASWYGALRLFAGDVPASVTALLGVADIQNYDPSGDLHMTAERFADGTP